MADARSVTHVLKRLKHVGSKGHAPHERFHELRLKRAQRLLLHWWRSALLRDAEMRLAAAGIRRADG